MQDYGYKGNFIATLNKAITENPEMTLAEVLAVGLHEANYKGKNFFYATDEEIYTSFESFNKIDLDDELYDDKGFEDWINHLKFAK